MKKFLHLFVVAFFCAIASSASAAEGDVTTVLEADFTQFKEGSPESPVAFPNYGTGSFSTYFKGWTTSKIGQGGGSLHIADGGYIQTASLNLSANDGISKVTLRVRAVDSYGGLVKIGIGYSPANSTTQMLEGNTWNEISVILGGGTSSSRVRVEPMLSASGIAIEWLKVEKSENFYPAPTAGQPNQADDTSFTATWSSVTGVTAYYIDVYSYNDKNEKVYFLKNEDCGILRSKKVTGLDPSTTYYYVVRAAKGAVVSADSNEIEVVKVIYNIDTPDTSDATVKEGKATFSWQPVKYADYYIVRLNRYTTLTADTDVKLLSEDFSGVKEGTLGNIEFTYNYKLDNYTKTPGWDGDNLGLADGNMVLTPFGGDTAYLKTPALELGSNNGAFNVTCKLAEGAFGSFHSGNTALLSLINAAGDTLETRQITLKENFNTYKEAFTKGANGAYIAISYKGDYKLFIDEITVEQPKKAGEVVSEIFGITDTEETSYTLDAPAANVKIGYTVTAVGRTVRAGQITDIASDPSKEKFIEATSAIGEIEGDSLTVATAGNGMIAVTAAEAISLTVYDLTGLTLYSGTVAPGRTLIETGLSSLVIVKAGSRTFKLAL